MTKRGGALYRLHTAAKLLATSHMSSQDASISCELASHMIESYWVEIETIGCESHSGWLGQGMQEGILEQMRAFSPLLVLQNDRQGDL